jgi:hypothetical protein
MTSPPGFLERCSPFVGKLGGFAKLVLITSGCTSLSARSSRAVPAEGGVGLVRRRGIIFGRWCGTVRPRAARLVASRRLMGQMGLAPSIRAHRPKAFGRKSLSTPVA